MHEKWPSQDHISRICAIAHFPTWENANVPHTSSPLQNPPRPLFAYVCHFQPFEEKGDEPTSSLICFHEPIGCPALVE